MGALAGAEPTESLTTRKRVGFGMCGAVALFQDTYFCISALCFGLYLGPGREVVALTLSSLLKVTL